ncbi:hypothetical protein H257_18855 [Aphanomyces astaci]|uniref:Uncharacterized protein n=1 Tax=Aphanomyces astaci TaxID=112090 RepID=W4F9Q4_APHAT|nr:hypothetical protein H257_18855 [Aphanomyces astaci]ETV64225.1 hypothetical protein H257_18855 [Aphanomyces astaci]|eukprot:XP_009846288.1 hypothetical protein H257_18855 [Aphanomyces astaci]
MSGDGRRPKRPPKSKFDKGASVVAFHSLFHKTDPPTPTPASSPHKGTKKATPTAPPTTQTLAGTTKTPAQTMAPRPTAETPTPTTEPSAPTKETPSPTTEPTAPTKGALEPTTETSAPSAFPTTTTSEKPAPLRTETPATNPPVSTMDFTEPTMETETSARSTDPPAATADITTRTTDTSAPTTDPLAPTTEAPTLTNDVLAPTMDLPTPTMDFLAPTMDFLVPTMDFPAPTMDFPAPTMDFLAPKTDTEISTRTLLTTEPTMDHPPAAPTTYTETPLQTTDPPASTTDLPEPGTDPPERTTETETPALTTEPTTSMTNLPEPTTNPPKPTTETELPEPRKGHPHVPTTDTMTDPACVPSFCLLRCHGASTTTPATPEDAEGNDAPPSKRASPAAASITQEAKRRKRLVRGDEMKRRRAITTGATEEVVHHELWRKFELDPARMLKSLHDFVEEVRCTHPKLEPAKKSDMDDAGLTPNEFKFLQSGKISLVPLLDMGFLEPAKTYKNLRNVMATRPVRKDEVTRHLNRLVKDGFLPTFNVVLFSPGPDGHKYGIVDGQHRIQAMCLLWNDRELFRGRTFEHLSRSTDDIPLIPALVLTSKEATPSQVLKYSLLLNKLYHYGNFSSVYYAICVLDKCMDWGLYKQSMMSRTIESGIRRGGKMVAMYDLCVQGLQDDRMDIPDAMRGISKAVSDDLIRVVCRLHHFGVMEKLVCSMDDPLSKKESSLMAINVWHKCMETMNNYYWFFRHCCTVKNVPWRRSDIDAAMQALMQLYLLSPEGIVLESLDRCMYGTWAAKTILFSNAIYHSIFPGTRTWPPLSAASKLSSRA